MISHDMIERNQALLIVLVILVVAVGGLVEIVPLYFQKTNTEPVAGLKPYSALQLTGRDVYVREGCYNCHSQMIRPILAETKRYGDYSKPDESMYDHPFQWGSRRIGPDLARVGPKLDPHWHLLHFRNPRDIFAESIMPEYSWLEKKKLDFDSIPLRVKAMRILGVPYTVEEEQRSAEHATEQAKAITREIMKSAPDDASITEDLYDKEVIALIAYLERLGADLEKAKLGPAPEPAADTAGQALPKPVGEPTARSDR